MPSHNPLQPSCKCSWCILARWFFDFKSFTSFRHLMTFLQKPWGEKKNVFFSWWSVFSFWSELFSLLCSRIKNRGENFCQDNLSKVPFFSNCENVEKVKINKLFFPCEKESFHEKRRDFLTEKKCFKENYFFLREENIKIHAKTFFYVRKTKCMYLFFYSTGFSPFFFIIQSK